MTSKYFTNSSSFLRHLLVVQSFVIILTLQQLPLLLVHSFEIRPQAYPSVQHHHHTTLKMNNQQNEQAQAQPQHRPMVCGVGLYHKITTKNKRSIPTLMQTINEYYTYQSDNAKGDDKASSSNIKRITVVSVDNQIVVVEEWNAKEDYDIDQKRKQEKKQNNTTLADILAANSMDSSHTIEYFPEIYHINNPIDSKTKTIGILVRQKTSSSKNGSKLRDAQKEAYERQMLYEPGCTCCIICANSSQDCSQVRIIELWKTINDFYFHENSEWHELGEEKVIPLVIDMDCDFVDGYQLLQQS